MTLYEFRLAGWCLHLLAFGVLSGYLFRLSAAAGQSLLIASIPFFACTIYGNTSPSYNTLSCDCLLLALSLRGLSALVGLARGRSVADQISTIEYLMGRTLLPAPLA